MASKHHTADTPKPLGDARVHDDTYGAWLRAAQKKGARLPLRASHVVLGAGLCLWLMFALRQSTFALVIALAGAPLWLLWQRLSRYLLARCFRALPQRRRVLSALLPGHAARVDHAGAEERVLLEQVVVGDVLRVRPREPIPVDGVVLEGRSAVDEQRLTGEPLPLDKRAGSHVIGGSRNGRGILLVRAQKAAHEGVLAGILNLLDGAEHTEASSTRAAAALAVALDWASLASALFAALIGALLLRGHGGATPLLLALAVLLAASADAITRTTELAVARASSHGAFLGVLARSADALENLARCDCLVVDKTETLTEPRARIVSVVAAEGSDADLLAEAAQLAMGSEHPLALALIARVDTLGIAHAPSAEVRIVQGEGCVTELDGTRLALGSRVLLARLGVHDVTLEAKADALRDHGQTVVFCVRGEQIRGLVGMTFPVKLTTRDALRELEEAGVRTVLASGDGTRTVQQLATALGVPEAHGDLSPHAKRALVEALRARGFRVCVAARTAALVPALAVADVGIALGSASSLEGNAAMQVFPADLAAIARGFTLGGELARSVRRQRRVAISVQAALPALLIALAAIGLTASLPLVGCLIGVARGVALTLSALGVARDRRQRADWIARV